jgi:beta-aspartyl-peptidase (threonine type)
MPIGIVVHGGAGDVAAEEHTARVRGVADAVREALPLLQRGGTALDAVEMAVRVLESFPLFHAGYGSAPNRDGVVELDAMIMDGKSAHFGAVAAVQRIEHPVSLARAVMERTPHHFLVGPGAEQFATEQGIPLIDPASLIAAPEHKSRIVLGGDTVGAVALDSLGNIAVAVSTGGIDNKLPGRVGDSPIAGAGGYADNALGAASATGVGEGIMRALLTYRAVDLMAGSRDAQQAVQQALDIFTQRFEGIGGLIAIDSQGRVGIAHNTQVMPVAYNVGDQIFAQIAGQGPVGQPLSGLTA